MGNDLFNENTIKRMVESSDLKISKTQKDSAKKWIELLEVGKLEKEKEGYFDFANLILKGILEYDISLEGLKHEEGNMEFSFKKSSGEFLVCFEAKGTKTKDLWAYQGRVEKSKETPVNQINTYLYEKKIPWGVLTNYKEFVLFSRKEGSKVFYKFDFLDIKKNPEKLREFIKLFSRESLENDFVEKVKIESEVEERKLTDRFYKLFHETRLMMLKEFQENGFEKKEALHYSQLYLNRLMFVFFAEDMNLIKRRIFEEMVIKVLENIDDVSSKISEEIGNLFEALDKGSPMREINQFNGGLFKENIKGKVYFRDLRPESFFFEIYKEKKNLQENLKLKEEEKKIFNKVKKEGLSPIVENMLLMASFDFKSDLKVNILGHIFEQSLSDLEELKEEKVSKRKKDGIFYTPEYITDYICRNTIVPYLSKSGTNDVDVLVEEYSHDLEVLEEKFNKIKILDPACGSGAFLIKAVDILFEIAEKVQNLKESYKEYEVEGWRKKAGQLTFKKFEERDKIKEIIENNIYGVDLNEESIETTKLSLFLRIAKRGKKLPDLSNHIKCGNSLIDDEEIAGDKAFKWKEEFKEIFDNGGFDVVVGNPPYVKARDYEDVKIRKYLDKKYKTTYKMWDLYIPFIEKGIDLLKKEGNFSMIIPDTIGKAEYTSKLVDLIESNYQLYQIDFFPEIYVFENVGVKSKIIFIKKQKSSEKTKRIAHTQEISKVKKLTSIEGKEKYIYEQSKINFKFDNYLFLDDICLVSYGLRLNSDKQDKKEKFKKEDLLSEKKTEINNKKYTEGKFLERYSITKKLFVEWGTERSPDRLVRPTFPELYPPKKLLMSRQKRIATLSIEGEICDNTIIMGILIKDLRGVENKSINKYFKNIGKERIKLEKISEGYNLSYLLSLINSKLIQYFIKYNSKGEIDTYPDDWKKIPVPKISPAEQKPFIEKADLMLNLNKEFYDKKNKLLNRVLELGVDKISRKLESFFELSFEEFVGELFKQKINLNLKQKDEWEDYFNEHKKEVSKLKEEINKTDKEIDKMVYALYGLTEKEIGVIDGSLK